MILNRISISFIILFFISFLASCNIFNDNTAAKVEESCKILEGKEIVDEDSLPCTYLEVYRYQEEIYTICVCCACFKCSPPTDCEGNILFACQNADWDQFRNNAEYLYAVSD